MPPGSVALNASKPTCPRHPLKRPVAERLGRLMAAAPIASAMAGASASASTPSSPSISRGSSRLTREMAAQPRTRRDAVDVVEVELVAGQRDVGEQPHILRGAVRRLEREQRRQIDAADFQVEVCLLRRRFGGALRLGIDVGAPHFRGYAQRLAKDAARRSLELQAAVGGHRMIEPEQREQGIAAFRREFRAKGHFAAAERIEIDRADR